MQPSSCGRLTRYWISNLEVNGQPDLIEDELKMLVQFGRIFRISIMSGM